MLPQTYRPFAQFKKNPVRVKKKEDNKKKNKLQNEHPIL